MLTVVGLCCAGVALFLIGIVASRHEIADTRGLDTIVAATWLCVAIPLAVFGALHLFGPQLVLPLVPKYMPWRLFWIYAVGSGLIAASVSIATRTAVR